MSFTKELPKFLTTMIHIKPFSMGNSCTGVNWPPFNTIEHIYFQYQKHLVLRLHLCIFSCILLWFKLGCFGQDQLFHSSYTSQGQTKGGKFEYFPMEK